MMNDDDDDDNQDDIYGAVIVTRIKPLQELIWFIR